MEGEDIEVILQSTSLTGLTDGIRVAFEITASPEGFYNSANTDTTPVHIYEPNTTGRVTISTIETPVLTESGTIDITVVRGNQL